PACRVIIFSAAAGLGLFVVQIVVYTPDLGAVMGYVGNQAGLQSVDISRSRMLLMVFLRSVLFLGPALGLAGLLGVQAWRRGDSNARTFISAFGAFLVAFVIAGLVFTRFFLIER